MRTRIIISNKTLAQVDCRNNSAILFVFQSHVSLRIVILLSIYALGSSRNLEVFYTKYAASFFIYIFLKSAHSAGKVGRSSRQAKVRFTVTL
jgi:hypothetical protein